MNVLLVHKDETMNLFTSSYSDKCVVLGCVADKIYIWNAAHSTGI